MHTPFLDAVVKAWAAQNAPGTQCAIRRTPDGTALTIEINAPRVLALLEVWESGRCLDVSTLDLASAQGTIHSAGPTKTPEEMEQRLAALREILQAYEIRS